MAHEINNSDRFGEVRVNGKRAWHGLGVEIADGLNAVEGFKAIGLDWQTELLPVYAERMTMDGIERIEAKEHKLAGTARNLMRWHSQPKAPTVPLDHEPSYFCARHNIPHDDICIACEREEEAHHDRSEQRANEER